MTDRDDGPEPEVSDLIMRAARSLRRRWMSSLEPWGVSPHEFRALRAALGGAERGGPARLSEIAESLRIAPRSATEVVDSLESKGLVQRTPSPADRRAVLVEPTDAGRALGRDVDSRRAEVGAAMLAPLDEADRTELRRLLQLALADEDDAPLR